MKFNNIYKIVAGIVMIINGAYIFFGKFNLYDSIRYSMCRLPALCSIAGGIMCIISVKKNVFLFFSSIMCFFAGIICCLTIHSFDWFSILCFLLWVLNIIFYEKMC